LSLVAVAVEELAEVAVEVESVLLLTLQGLALLYNQLYLYQLELHTPLPLVVEGQEIIQMVLQELLVELRLFLELASQRFHVLVAVVVALTMQTELLVALVAVVVP
jgi:hypothetical protein